MATCDKCGTDYTDRGGPSLECDCGRKVDPGETLYQALVAAGVPVDHHESDLYCQATKAALDILKRFPVQRGNARTFVHRQLAQLWIDVPFAYDPWWEARATR